MQLRRLLFALALAAPLAPLACGSDATGVTPVVRDAGADGSKPADAAPADGALPPSDAAATTDAALGAPISAPANQWTWVDFPDAVCDDGSPTGIGVNPSATGDKLVVFLNGGGACWDYETCIVLATSTHGPFGAAQFAPLAASGFSGSILDRNAPDNPFKNYSMVFVPYCTGDLHAGDAVQTYTTDAGQSAVVHHKGRANVRAYLARLAATFKTPGQVALTGSSAGGGGALFNYPAFHDAWPATPMMLVDDSLPLFEGDAVSATLRNAWSQSWNLAPLVGSFCGAACANDMSAFMKALSTAFPGDPMALLSSEQDATIRTYLGLTAQQYQTDLTALAHDVLEPTPNFRHFFVTGGSHTMLGAPTPFVAAGVPLWTWLAKMESRDPTWASVGP